MCQDAPHMIQVGDLLINHAQVVATAFLAATSDKAAMLNILTTSLHDGDEGIASESLYLGGREAEALHHFLSRDAANVMTIFDCHQGKHVYPDDSPICQHCARTDQDRYSALRAAWEADPAHDYSDF